MASKKDKNKVKVAKCPACGELHEAKYNYFKARPSYQVWCDEINEPRNVLAQDTLWGIEQK